jgi:hypothetical protein
MSEKVSLRHRGYLYAQEVFAGMRALGDQHPTIQRMRLADAWRAGYIAGAREQSRADVAAVKRLETVIRAGEHILDSETFDWRALQRLRTRETGY